MTQLTRFLKIRISNNQYERMKQNMHANNCTTIAQYIREVTIGRGFFTENLISENHKMLKEIIKILQEWKK